jgi:hypothetical protein
MHHHHHAHLSKEPPRAADVAVVHQKRGKASRKRWLTSRWRG